MRIRRDKRELVDEFLEKTNPNMCPAPFNQIYEEPNGDVKPCCVFRATVGNLNEQTHEEILNSDVLKRTRKHLLAGKPPPECATCFYGQKDLHGNRAAAFDFTTDWEHGVNITAADGTIDVDKFKLEFYDVVSSNECNFACAGCTPVLSSTIAKNYFDEIALLKGKEGYYSPNNNWKDYDNKVVGTGEKQLERRLALINKHLPHLNTVHLNGGEPFIGDYTYDMLDALTKSTNPDLYVWSHTNGSVRRMDLIEKYLDAFPGRKMEIAISIDHMGKRGEYIRYGWKEKKWLETYNKLKKLTQIAPGTCVSVMNLLTIDQYLDWHKEHKLGMIGWMIWNDRNLNITLFKDTPMEKRAEEMIDRIGVDRIADFYYNTEPTGDYYTFYQTMKMLDLKRGTNFEETFPELEWFANESKARAKRAGRRRLLSR